MFVLTIVYSLLVFYIYNASGTSEVELPGYEFHAHLHGSLKLHAEPTDWQAARDICLAEDGQLAAAWSANFLESINELQRRSDPSLPVLFSGARTTLPPVDRDAAPFLYDWERCGAIFANGTTGEVDCAQQLPYVCYAHKAVSPSDCSNGRPGYEYREQVRGWLKLHQRPASWLAARVSCHMEGAFLASPWSPEFSTAIQSILSGFSQGPHAIRMLFSGIHNQITFAEGLLTGNEDELAMSLEPSGMAWLERCGVFHANGSEGEADCKQLLPYVCYAPDSEAASSPAPTLAPTTASTPVSTIIIYPTNAAATDSTIDSIPEPICGDESLGYEFNNQTGNCYKFHTAAAIVPDAKATCAEGGAHLASPNNHAERRALIDLFERNPWETVENSAYVSVIVTGIHAEDGVWKTADGQSIDEDIEEKWPGPSPPTSDDSYLPYLYMYVDGSVQRLNGMLAAPFICEKRAASRN